MQKKLHIIISILLLFAVLISCTGCFGYATRLPNNIYDKVDKVVFGVNGDEYILEGKYHNSDFYDFLPVIKSTLKSGKADISNAFAQVKMPCDDSAVEYDKEAYDLWFELSIENGKYKKLFFTMNKNDTQTLWIYATETDSYDDGGFLQYCSCDCRELVTLATHYAEDIIIDGPTKIEITKYDIGEELGKVTLTEEASIKRIVDNFTSLKLKELKHNDIPTAIEYELTFYGEGGEVIQTISITLDGWVEYHGSLHSVIVGELDIEYIAGLLE